jgi:hypothetical protein
VILHGSSFVILSVHFIFVICLNHLFINVCNLLVIWLLCLLEINKYLDHEIWREISFHWHNQNKRKSE